MARGGAGVRRLTARHAGTLLSNGRDGCHGNGADESGVVVKVIRVYGDVPTSHVLFDVRLTPDAFHGQCVIIHRILLFYHYFFQFFC